MEMTGSFVISMAANIINPAFPCRSAGSSVQSHISSVLSLLISTGIERQAHHCLCVYNHNYTALTHYTCL